MKFLKVYGLQSKLLRTVFLGGTLLSILTSTLSADIVHTKTNFYKKLESGQIQKLVVVGTSVSVANYANYWPQRLVEELNKRFQYNVYYTNLSSPSTKDDYLVAATTQGAIAAEHPDLVIYEVCTGVPTSNVDANLRSIIRQTRVNCPDADILFWCPWPTPNHTNNPVSINYSTCTPYMTLAKQIAADSSIHWVPTWAVMDSIYRADPSQTCFANREQDTYTCPLYSQYLWDGYHPSIFCVKTIIIPWMLKTLKGLDAVDTSIVSEPVLLPYSGTYATAQNVTMTCATAGATIRYTTDGSQPTSTSTVYSTGLVISQTTTIKAQAFKAGKTNSPVVSQLFTIKTAAPVFSPLPGGYAAPLAVTLTAPGATIRYTTDGSDPTQTNGTLYSSPISISSARAIKAIAYNGTMDQSVASSGIFYISDSIYYDTTTRKTGSGFLKQTAMIPCLFRPSTWNRMELTFDSHIVDTNYGYWVGFTLFDQGPAINPAGGNYTFPSQCLVVGHQADFWNDRYHSDGSHNLSIWKMAPDQYSPSKYTFLQRRLPWYTSYYTSYKIVFRKLTGGPVELSVTIGDGQTEYGTLCDTINATQWNSVVAANSINMTAAGEPPNGGAISIRNIRVTRTNESISIPVKEVPKKAPIFNTGASQNNQSITIYIGGPGHHTVNIYTPQGSVLYSATGTGEHQYIIPQKQLASGIYFIQVKTGTKNFTQAITKCVR